jgi:hypothetical protein
MARIVHFHRGVMGWSFEILFYLFNLVMAIAIISVIGSSGDILAAAETALSRGLAEFGAATKLFVLLFAWMVGDLILGSLTLISRSRIASIEE